MQLGGHLQLGLPQSQLALFVGVLLDDLNGTLDFLQVAGWQH